MPDERDPRLGDPGRRPDAPEYKVYRSRRGLFDRLRTSRELPGMRDIRRDRERAAGLDPRPERPARPAWRSALKYLLIAVVAWIALSYVVFLGSAQLTPGVSDEAEDALSPGGSLLTGSTVLVLGSDARESNSLERGPGGQLAREEPGRADSILLLRVSATSVRRLSILRDSAAEIPGHGVAKINAAYALGGAALTIETVESFLGNGLEVNHVIEVSLEDFPDLIDALGGIDVTIEDCIKSQAFGGRRFFLHRGEHHLNGRRALAFARVRTNSCAPNEDDRARARRQQQVLSAMRSRVLSPTTFVRLPWVAWEAPRSIRSDLKGPGLSALFSDLLVGGAGSTHVLEPSAPGPLPGSLSISEAEKSDEVDRLLGR